MGECSKSYRIRLRVFSFVEELRNSVRVIFEKTEEEVIEEVRHGDSCSLRHFLSDFRNR